jgi:membrane-bound ClpP family serine protease
MADKVIVNNNTSGGVGVLGLLGVAFVVLKLIGVINWSWWWVTAPFWGPFVLLLAILAAVVLGFAISELAKVLFRRKRKKVKAASRAGRL